MALVLNFLSRGREPRVWELCMAGWYVQLAVSVSILNFNKKGLPSSPAIIRDQLDSHRTHVLNHKGIFHSTKNQDRLEHKLFIQRHTNHIREKPSKHAALKHIPELHILFEHWKAGVGGAPTPTWRITDLKKHWSMLSSCMSIAGVRLWEPFSVKASSHTQALTPNGPKHQMLDWSENQKGTAKRLMHHYSAPSEWGRPQHKQTTA